MPVLINTKNLFHSFLLILLFIGCIFTDLPLGDKTVLHSPMILIATSVFIVLLISNGFKLNLTKNLRVFLVYLIITFINSLLLILGVIFIKGDIEVFGTNLLIKNFEAFISLTLLHFFVYYNFVNVFRMVRFKFIKSFIIFTFMFLSCVAFIEYLNPKLIDFFHSAPKEYDRLRLLSSEPSQAILVYAIFGILSISLVKDKLSKILSILVFITVIYLIQSKGFFISLFLATMFTFFTYKKNWFRLRTSVIIFLMTIFSVYGLFNIAIPAILLDIENFSSFSTRLSGIISLFLILIKFPIGLGYGTYLYLYPDILDKSYTIANNFFINHFGITLSYVEIKNMISTGINLGAKAGIPQSIMFNGWLGVLFWAIVFYNTFKLLSNRNIFNKFTVNELYFRFLTWVMFFQLLYGSDYALLYVIWIPFALIEVLNKKEAYNEKT
ncbi:MAG: O-antigen polymerase [Minisyncoccia bacterium]